MPKVIQVIQSEICRGDGKSWDDMCRTVIQYHTLDGEFLAEYDSHPTKEKPKGVAPFIEAWDDSRLEG